MLLVLDVGNTQTVLGVYARPAGFKPGRNEAATSKLRAHWRVATIRTQTVDEYGVLFRNLFAMEDIQPQEVHGIIISSVVPPVDSLLLEVGDKYFRPNPLVIEPRV